MELADTRLDESLREQEPQRRRERQARWWQEGPPHALSLEWATERGADYVALLLWIVKDWSWSQWRWTVSAFAFGTAAAIWIVGTTLYTTYQYRLYSETFKGFVLTLWLAALYVWMMGEFWTLWMAHHEMYENIFQDGGATIAKWVLLVAVLLYTTFFVVAVPLDVFAEDRQNSKVLQRLEETSPSFPARNLFKEFRIYSALHFYTWVLKDCMWAWELPTACALAFGVTIGLNFDLLWRFASNKNENNYIDLIHYVVIFLWVVANGLWAFGELVANTTATDDQFRKYTWPHWKDIPRTTFHFRYAAGWVFFVAASILVVFYLHWIVRTLQGRLLSYREFDGLLSTAPAYAEQAEVVENNQPHLEDQREEPRKVPVIDLGTEIV